MRLARLLLVLLAVTASAFAQEANYKLVFEDNFDGGKLDTETWDIRSGNWYGRGNCTGDALALKDGVLSVTAWTENKLHWSGRITMKSSRNFGFLRGKVEGRLRVNPTPGVCAIFSNNTDEKDAKQPQMGLEIFSSWGHEKGRAYSTGIGWADPNNGAQKKERKQEHEVSFGKFWHTYGVEWDEAGYRFTMDGKSRMTVKNPEGIAARRGITLGCMLPEPENTKADFGPKGKAKPLYEVDWVKIWERVPAAK
jgi:beta-glucanase (GH16 family)